MATKSQSQWQWNYRISTLTVCNNSSAVEGKKFQAAGLNKILIYKLHTEKNQDAVLPPPWFGPPLVSCKDNICLHSILVS